MTNRRTSWSLFNLALVLLFDLWSRKLKSFKFVLSIVILTASLSAYADTNVKVGFVNIASLMEKAPQADAARKALEKEFSARDSKLKAERDGIIDLENKLKTDGDIMSESKRAKLERDILKRKREFKRANVDGGRPVAISIHHTNAAALVIAGRSSIVPRINRGTGRG